MQLSIADLALSLAVVLPLGPQARLAFTMAAFNVLVQ